MNSDEVKAALTARGLHDVAAAVDGVAARMSGSPLGLAERMYRDGRLGQVGWEAYLYLWRNSTHRYGEEFDAYSLDTDPKTGLPL